MRASRTITIGARASALSQLQARLVGAALLAHEPRLAIRYVFAEAAGDRDLAAALPALLREGGFTDGLSQALAASRIDLAVHSWKDLPFTRRSMTRIAATLERADPRDLLLVRRDRLAPARRRGLRVLSCSARRASNLREFLPWALPGGDGGPVSFHSVRGDILRRLRQLLQGEADALVVAKAAIDRLLSAGSDATVRAQVYSALGACRIMVLPLAANPAAPAQGALAIEIRRDRTDLLELLAAINHAPSHARALEERAQLATAGDEDHPLGVSIVPVGREPGTRQAEAIFLRGSRQGVPIESAELRDREPPLPPAQRGAVWAGEPAGSQAWRRIPLGSAPVPNGDGQIGLLVARAEALPDAWLAGGEPIIWTAGLSTWRRLAARGVWVSGSDESLGETGAIAARHLFPQVLRWIKLTHEAGYDPPQAARVATYRLERIQPLENIGRHTHFFWHSGSQFREYLCAYPRLREAWHGSGPGNTLAIIRAEIGSERVRAFLSAAHFRAALGA